MKAIFSILQILSDFFLAYLPFKIHSDYRFAFLIHARDISDMYRRFPFAKKLPDSFLEFYCKHSWPIVVYKKRDEKISGYIIGVPMTAKQILENRELAVKRITRASKLAENLGAKIIGLGALTSSVTRGGVDLVDKVNPIITTGNTFTAAVTVEHVSQIIDNNSIEKVAIIGATGSIGQGVLKTLIKKFPDKEYLLFARTKENLDNLINEIKSISKNVLVKGFINNFDSLKQAGLVVMATSGAGSLLSSKDFKEKAIIYDMTQPKNIPDDIIEKRKDITLIEGGLVKSPIDIKFNFGLPKGYIFSCLAETMILALEKRDSNFSIDKVKVEQIAEIDKLAKKHNFIT